MTLLGLLTSVAVLSLLFAIATAALSVARKSSHKRDCVNHLRQLGTYVVLYATKFGSARDYPPAPGHGFYETLSRVPTPGAALTRGDDSMASCPVLRRATHPSVIDYREPGPGLPGGRLRDGLTQPQWPIACDRPTNHDPSGQDDINIMFLSGSVSPACYGSPEWTTAMNYTK